MIFYHFDSSIEGFITSEGELRWWRLKSLICLLWALLLLFPSTSFAKKIKLSDSVILEQKNSLDTNYSYKNQNNYFNQINSNQIKDDSNNIY